MLTDTAIKALKPKDKLYKIVDRDGMYVVVQPSGSIVFRLTTAQRPSGDLDVGSLWPGGSVSGPGA
jgi:hypothetical protein